MDNYKAQMNKDHLQIKKYKKINVKQTIKQSKYYTNQKVEFAISYIHIQITAVNFSYYNDLLHKSIIKSFHLSLALKETLIFAVTYSERLRSRAMAKLL